MPYGKCFTQTERSVESSFIQLNILKIHVNRIERQTDRPENRWTEALADRKTDKIIRGIIEIPVEMLEICFIYKSLKR